MSSPITKAIFPVAGLGTRFLPATKTMPKEMLPIVDKPILQYAVEEVAAAGISELIFITNASKHAIEDYFDTSRELEDTLVRRKQFERLDFLKNLLPGGISFIYVHQAQPLGLGHAVLCAKNLIGDQPFAVILADDLIEEDPDGCLKNMISVFEVTGRSVIALEEVPREDCNKYGIVDIKKTDKDYSLIETIVEKPDPFEAPSNYAVVGRYILTPQIFPILETIKPDANGEIQLTDAIAELLNIELVFGYFLKGKRYDCGSKLGYLQAVVAYALKHPELKKGLKSFLQNFMK